MDFSNLGWVFAVPVVLFGGIFIFAIFHQRALMGKWRAWAGERGWKVHGRDKTLVREFSGGALGEGSESRALFGYDGVFDGQPAAGFRHRSSRGKSVQDSHVCLIRVPGASFPKLTLAAEGLADRAFGEDIDFEDAEFNRRWFVKGSDPRFAHDVIHPRLMEWLNTAHLPTFSFLWFENDALLVSVEGTLEPDEVDVHLRFLSGILASIPPFVLENVGSVPVQVSDEGPSPLA